MLKSEIEKLTDMQKFNLLVDNYHKLRGLMNDCKQLITDSEKLQEFLQARYGDEIAVGDIEHKLTDLALPVILPMVVKGVNYNKTIKSIPVDSSSTNSVVES